MEVVAWVHPGAPSPRAQCRHRRTDSRRIDRTGASRDSTAVRTATYFNFRERSFVILPMVSCSTRSGASYTAVAIWMEEHLEDELAANYSSLARHWYSAHGQSEQSLEAVQNAVRYYELAGDRALKTYASVEAIEFYDNALRCLGDLESGDETAAWELRLLIKMGEPICANYQYGNDRVIALYERERP